MNWLNNFDERQRKEIEFSTLYLNQFEHGTDGHNAKVIIARMASLLDKVESHAMELVNEIISVDKLPNEKQTIYLAHKVMEIFK